MDWLKRWMKKETPSDLTLHRDPEGVFILRIVGVLTDAGLTAFRQRAASELDEAGTMKLLVILEDFRGWEKGPAMNDVSFMMQYDSKELKIAIVGDAKWEEPFLLWMGAGRRLAQVKYFAGNDVATAQEWLKVSPGRVGGEDT